MSIGGATYDLFVRTDKQLVHECKEVRSLALPLGEKVQVKEVIETCGGGASNTAVGLARLGCSAGFCGVIGSDQWGEKLLENLKSEGVDVECATVVENEVSSFSIILSSGGGERVILYTPGTNTHLHDANFGKETASAVDWVVLNHIQEGSCVIQDDLIDILAAEGNPRFTWNPGGCQIDAGITEPNNRKLLAHTDLLLLNKEEAMRFLQADSPEQAIRTAVEIGTKNICVTDGKNGTIASDGKQLFSCSILNTETVDTTGAGDAFDTGMTWALLTGKDLPTALKAGTINAASVVGAIGAQAGLLTDSEIHRKLQSVDLDVAARPL